MKKEELEKHYNHSIKEIESLNLYINDLEEQISLNKKCDKINLKLQVENYNLTMINNSLSNEIQRLTNEIMYLNKIIDNYKIMFEVKYQ